MSKHLSAELATIGVNVILGAKQHFVSMDHRICLICGSTSQITLFLKMMARCKKGWKLLSLSLCAKHLPFSNIFKNNGNEFLKIYFDVHFQYALP